VTRDECLEAARLCISHDRNETYGSPSSSFGVVAALWTTLLSGKLRPGAKLAARDAILCMAALKLARLAHNPAHDDSAIDLSRLCRHLRRGVLPRRGHAGGHGSTRRDGKRLARKGRRCIVRRWRPLS